MDRARGAAAYELGLSQKTVRRYVDRGDLLAVRLGDGRSSPIRFRRRDLDDFIEDHVMPASSEDELENEED
jgi:excisionase family DNA binding protein